MKTLSMFECGGLAVALCLGLSACDDPQAADDGLSEEVPTPRGERICELFELTIVDDHLGADVWNNGDFHDCPDEYLAAIDRDRYAVGGPRWRSVDEIETIGADGQPLDFELDVAEVPAGLGHDMFLAAQVSLVPLADLEQTLGITIEAVDDIPAQARQMVRDSTIAGRDYDVIEVDRAVTTRMVHHAGNEVFVLDDGRCRYAMKFYTSVVDSSLTHEGAVARLGDRFERLPEGWSFHVRTFDEDLVVSDTDGVAHVIADEFGNSYDRYECD